MEQSSLSRPAAGLRGGGQAMVSADLEERMLPEEPEEPAEEADWEDSWVGPLILLGLLVAGLIAAIVVLATYKGHAPSPPQPSGCSQGRREQPEGCVPIQPYAPRTGGLP